MKKLIFLTAIILAVCTATAQWYFQNPNPTSSVLNGVCFIDDTHGWVTGEAGNILHTTDGGSIWTMQYSGTSETLYEICFADPYKGWVRGQDSSLFHTSNGGNTWIKQYTFPNSIRSICFPDTDNGWAACDGIMHTTDGGYTWQKQNTGGYAGFADVYFIDADNGWAVGGGHPILHTSDGGVSWEEQTCSYNQRLTAVHFTDTLNGWAVGRTSNLNGIIIHTSDGGNNWNLQQYVGTGLSKVFFSDSLNGWASSIHSGPFFYTTNGGETWETQTTGMFVKNDFCFINSDQGWCVGLGFDFDGAIAVTTDGGSNWESQVSKLGLYDYAVSVSFPDQSNGWAVAIYDDMVHYSEILHTGNGGENWKIRYSTNDYLNDIVFVNENKGWLIGKNENNDAVIWHSSDTGTTWNDQFSDNNLNLYDLCFIDIYNGWVVGSNAAILHTTDGGNNWEEQFGNADISFSNICFVDNLNGWVIGREYNQGNALIYHTTDGGKNWKEQFSEPGIWFRGISFPDAENGWIVDFYGIIFHTNDGGVNWEVQYSDATKFLCNVFFSNSDYGWAVGWAGVILYTTNGGESWEEQFSGTNNTLNDIIFTDVDQGWIVGGFGVILHTDNGGITGFEEIKIQSSSPDIKSYPNPFTTSTTIEYELKQSTTIQITIYNHLGKQLEVIQQTQSAGKQQVVWNAEGLPAGVYYCVLITDPAHAGQTIKMIKL